MQTMSEAIKQRLAEGKNIGLYPVTIPKKLEDNMKDFIMLEGGYKTINPNDLKCDLFINGKKIATAADFERVKAQLSRLDDVEGLALTMQKYDFPESSIARDIYKSRAQAVINYIKGV